jgi:hypothetical protein
LLLPNLEELLTSSLIGLLLLRLEELLPLSILLTCLIGVEWRCPARKAADPSAFETVADSGRFHDCLLSIATKLCIVCIISRGIITVIICSTALYTPFTKNNIRTIRGRTMMIIDILSHKRSVLHFAQPLKLGGFHNLSQNIITDNHSTLMTILQNMRTGYGIGIAFSHSSL